MFEVRERDVPSVPLLGPNLIPEGELVTAKKNRTRTWRWYGSGCSLLQNLHRSRASGILFRCELIFELATIRKPSYNKKLKSRLQTKKQILNRPDDPKVLSGWLQRCILLEYGRLLVQDTLVSGALRLIAQNRSEMFKVGCILLCYTVTPEGRRRRYAFPLCFSLAPAAWCFWIGYILQPPTQYLCSTSVKGSLVGSHYWTSCCLDVDGSCSLKAEVQRLDDAST